MIKKGLDEKDKKWWCCDKILVHLKNLDPIAFRKTMQCEDIKGHELVMGEKISTNWANDMKFKCHNWSPKK
jgi:hypothetical protein